MTLSIGDELAQRRTVATGIAQDAIFAWAMDLHRLRRRLTPPMLTDCWIDGLKAAGVRARNAKVWRGKYQVDLPLVIEFPCPFWHRTEDRRDIARVLLLIEDDGWVTLDADSPCPMCDPDVLERWLLTCPRCEADEDTPEHDPAHDSFAQQRNVTVVWCGGESDAADDCGDLGPFEVVDDVSPYAFVLYEFQRRKAEAWATWFLNCPDARTLLLSEGVPEASVGHIIEVWTERARAILGQVTSAIAAIEAIAWTDESAAAWLDAQRNPDGSVLVPETATVRQAWALAGPLIGRPSKNQIETAQTLRKGRGSTDP